MMILICLKNQDHKVALYLLLEINLNLFKSIIHENIISKKILLDIFDTEIYK